MAARNYKRAPAAAKQLALALPLQLVELISDQQQQQQPNGTCAIRSEWPSSTGWLRSIAAKEAISPLACLLVERRLMMAANR